MGYCTSTSPIIPSPSCGTQKYGYRPGAVKVYEKVPPGPRSEEWKDPSRALTSCTCCPTFRQVTVVPTFTVSSAGSKKCSASETVAIRSGNVALGLALAGDGGTVAEREGSALGTADAA